MKRTHGIFLAYAPRGPALRVALAYLGGERDVCGWFTGPRDDGAIESAFFLLKDFYTARPMRYESVAQADLHSAWQLDEARRHELARMQEAFAREWLLYGDDPAAAEQLKAYAEAELAIGEINVRFERLARFSTQQPNWTYYSPGFERAVLRPLAARWPLEYRLDLDPVRNPRPARGGR